MAAQAGVTYVTPRGENSPRFMYAPAAAFVATRLRARQPSAGIICLAPTSAVMLVVTAEKSHGSPPSATSRRFFFFPAVLPPKVLGLLLRGRHDALWYGKLASHEELFALPVACHHAR